MVSITARGFCADAPESRNTSVLPRRCCKRTGKPRRTRSTSKAGASTAPSMLRDLFPPAGNGGGQCVAGRLVLHRVDGFLREGLGQHGAGGGGGNAAGAQVEELVLVQLAHRGSVGALHVVGVDFQLRL